MSKPWSQKKRIRVALVCSLGIFGLALLIGTLIYGISRGFNLTTSGSIKKKVLKEALADTKLSQAYVKALTTKTCINQTWGYQVVYDQPLRQLDVQPPGECTRFEIVGINDRLDQVIISRRKEAKEEVVRQIIASLTAVATDSLPQTEWEITSIWGLKDNQPYQAYVLANSTQQTFLIEYLPADANGLTAVKEMAKNFSQLRK